MERFKEGSTLSSIDLYETRERIVGVMLLAITRNISSSVVRIYIWGESGYSVVERLESKEFIKCLVGCSPVSIRNSGVKDSRVGVGRNCSSTERDSCDSVEMVVGIRGFSCIRIGDLREIALSVISVCNSGWRLS